MSCKKCEFWRDRAEIAEMVLKDALESLDASRRKPMDAVHEVNAELRKLKAGLDITLAKHRDPWNKDTDAEIQG